MKILTQLVHLGVSIETHEVLSSELMQFISTKGYAGEKVNLLSESRQMFVNI